MKVRFPLRVPPIPEVTTCVGEVVGTHERSLVGMEALGRIKSVIGGEDEEKNLTNLTFKFLKHLLKKDQFYNSTTRSQVQ